MNPSNFRFLTLLLLMLLTPQSSRATTVLESTPRSLAVRSGVIFAGRVTQKVAEYRENGGTIVTKYTFRDLAFAKGGTPRDSLVLIVAGGNVGGAQLIVDGQPIFQVGDRYIVFSYGDLGSPSNSYMPVVGLHQGQFRVTSQGPTPGRVTDSTGNPVVRVSPSSISVVIARTQDRTGNRMEGPPAVVPTLPDERSPHIFLSSKDDPGTRFSEKEFLAFFSDLR